jgi:hypothetical protein
MTKDSDRDLIDRIDSAISEEIRDTLANVIEVQLKPMFQSLQRGQIVLEKRMILHGRRCGFARGFFPSTSALDQDLVSPDTGYTALLQLRSLQRN